MTIKEVEFNKKLTPEQLRERLEEGMLLRLVLWEAEAKAHKAYYDMLLGQGFNEEQALILCKDKEY